MEGNRGSGSKSRGNEERSKIVMRRREGTGTEFHEWGNVFLLASSLIKPDTQVSEASAWT